MFSLAKKLNKKKKFKKLLQMQHQQYEELIATAGQCLKRANTN